jgi:hypothetical protein
VKTDSLPVEFKLDRPFRWDAHIPNFQLRPTTRHIEPAGGNLRSANVLSARPRYCACQWPAGAIQLKK